MTRLPDFIVLGQGKAGTSLIYRVLRANPRIGVSRKKELLFFSRRARGSMDWYSDQFAQVDPGATRVGEVSPAYLNPHSIGRIHETLGDALDLIFVLRRPTEQSYSRYLQNLCASGEGVPFERSLHAIERNCDEILRAIEKCHDIYGRDRILALSYERNIKGAGDYERLICDFLGVPFEDHAAPFRTGARVNPGVMPHYLYGGTDGLEIDSHGAHYRIPPGHLVFCAQPRNSWGRADPTAEQVTEALEGQEHWTRALEDPLLAEIHEKITLPFARALEDRFGHDMSHWRTAPGRIAYDAAPPPKEYLAERL